MQTPGFGRLFGIETEYGIWVEGRGAGDLMDESRRLVQSWRGIWAGPWDYSAEAPRHDMRGFEVRHLNYDEADARWDREGTTSHLSSAEQRADRALTNGARLYNDHGHPEYSTPECSTLADLVAHDRAGERIVQELARLRSAETGRDVRIYKNNTDFHGASYGCHEGYLCRRDVPFDHLLQGMLPFLVTRILWCGAGKVGVETGGPFAAECPYQLSQRADFFTEIASVDTLARRPIFNTRDEPHADPQRYRRLHVICGDAGMSEWTTAMKVGVTSLVLSLLEAGWEPLVELKDPVDAFQRLSRDPSWRWLVELRDGRTMRAVDLQRIYLRDAQSLLGTAVGEVAWVLREWERVLNDLDRDPYLAEDRVDWVAKRRLLETFIESEQVWWEDPMLKSLDLEYSNLHPEEGLFWALEEAGQMVRLTSEEEVSRARDWAPAATRAALRGALVRHFGSQIRRISWDGVLLETDRGPQRLRLPANGEESAGALPLARGTSKTPQEERELLLTWIRLQQNGTVVPPGDADVLDEG